MNLFAFENDEALEYRATDYSIYLALDLTVLSLF